jgi:crotonobetainyl-CoA:carnitine CoA-transferase CaiB-like acyl-CoA transferase
VVTLPRGALGEHTEEILEEAGIAAFDRAALRASGIISS